MKSKLTKKKQIFLTVLFLAAVAVWIWRYLTINSFYQEHTTKTIAYYSMGEVVPFGSDFLALHESAEDCYIQVENFEIVDFTEYTQNHKISLDSRQVEIPDKLVLVHITLQNDGIDDQDINLANFALFGIDSNPPMDYDLLCQINPILSGGIWEITLSQNGEYQITLPYMLFKQYYKNSTWNNLDNYTFYLQCTSIPTVKCIRIGN